MASKDSDSDKNSVLMSDIDVDMNGEITMTTDEFTGFGLTPEELLQS